MPEHGGKLWAEHPHVNNDLSLGEKAADWLKHWFGTWTALGLIALSIMFWIVCQHIGVNFDPYPFILLNLCLSCLAAIQGIILQISANRQDKINAQAQVLHETITQEIADNTKLLHEIHAHVQVLTPEAGEFDEPSQS